MASFLPCCCSGEIPQDVRATFEKNDDRRRWRVRGVSKDLPRLGSRTFHRFVQNRDDCGVAREERRASEAVVLCADGRIESLCEPRVLSGAFAGRKTRRE